MGLYGLVLNVRKAAFQDILWRCRLQRIGFVVSPGFRVMTFAVLSGPASTTTWPPGRRSLAFRGWKVAA
jgi:hypothetical protein